MSKDFFVGIDPDSNKSDVANRFTDKGNGTVLLAAYLVAFLFIFIILRVWSRRSHY